MKTATDGTARVLAITRTPAGTKLVLRSVPGAEEQVLLDEVPDSGQARVDSWGVRRPVAVIIRLDRALGGDCTLLGTSRMGPVRRKTTLRSALGLCEAGVPTVVLRAGM